jgi:SAM-dependent methyltransferase
MLGNGRDRGDLLVSLVQSEEFCTRLVTTEVEPPILPSLLAQRPERYRRVGEFLAFVQETDADYDFLESAIVANGYYERRGNWAYELNEDHRVLADLMGAVGATNVLELGCGFGGALHCVQEKGIAATGLDLSEDTKRRALASVRDSIITGDLLGTEFSARFDMIAGFDIFEHLNPNKIDTYFAKCAALLIAGGHLVINVPAFGEDDVFGTVFPYWIPEWTKGKNERGLFRLMPCDELGYPMLGHLIWTEPSWWEAAMQRHGFARARDIERCLHRQFDERMAYSVARLSYFVMRRKPA